MAEHAVIAHLRLSAGGFGTSTERQQFMELEQRLEQSIKKARVGEFDGNEFGDGECVWYMYGPDADALWGAVEPIVRAAAQAGSFVVKRRGAPGDPNAKEERIEL